MKGMPSLQTPHFHQFAATQLLELQLVVEADQPRVMKVVESEHSGQSRSTGYDGDVWSSGRNLNRNEKMDSKAGNVNQTRYEMPLFKGDGATRTPRTDLKNLETKYPQSDEELASPNSEDSSERFPPDKFSENSTYESEERSTSKCTSPDFQSKYSDPIDRLISQLGVERQVKTPKSKKTQPETGIRSSGKMAAVVGNSSQRSSPPQSEGSQSRRSFHSSQTLTSSGSSHSSQDLEDRPSRHQSEGNKHGRNRARALKGMISIQQKVKLLGKNKPDEYQRKVVVNGAPIADVDVKKAEESAGPIHPGKYWYDIQAGFWGVDSGPCVGIIPSFIPEFDTPMSRSCAGGDTNILVNGRELHQKDLRRLSSRGLPTIPGLAYRISVDGRVVDEASGKYLGGLGDLAPSLEKTKRGAGIYIPYTP